MGSVLNDFSCNMRVNTFEYNQGAAWQRLQTTLHPMWYNNYLKQTKILLDVSTKRPWSGELV